MKKRNKLVSMILLLLMGVFLIGASVGVPAADCLSVFVGIFFAFTL